MTAETVLAGGSGWRRVARHAAWLRASGGARCAAQRGFLLLTLLAGCTSGQGALAGDGPPSFRALAKEVLPTVVSISVTETAAAADADAGDEGNPPPIPDRQGKVLGAGSGFIIDPSGIIVTNDHVVNGATRIVVSLSDGQQLPAHVLGVDQLTDIAVLKVAAGHPLPAAHWGLSDQVDIGDWIIVAGNPFGLGSTITAGIISARGRDIMSGPFDDFLQLDAPINPGNSGGPTFDMTGGVVGVTTAIISPTGGSVGIGFAIPSKIAKPVVEQIVKFGHLDRGWLGVGVENTSSSPATVRITTVERRGPAAHAGLRVGDEILSVDGRAVGSALGLIRAIAEIHPGGRATLRLRRQGRAFAVTVTVGLRPETSAP